MDVQTPLSARSTQASIAMLRAVLDGRTYDAVAADAGVTRTAVERRVKSLAVRLCREVGVEGFNEGAAGFVRRLRDSREAILEALTHFDPSEGPHERADRLLTEEEIARAALRIRGRSAQPWRDVALFYVLFVTGARPLEIARLRVCDYLAEEGTVRCESELPAEASITGKSRPLYFASHKLDEALDHYLQQRATAGYGTGSPDAYRGLDPQSRLFLTQQGEGFRIEQYGEQGQQRHLCRAILETYRKLFRYGELQGATPLSVRRTVAARLYDRGADEEQVGLVLGISERSAVRGMFPKTRRTMASLVKELV